MTNQIKNTCCLLIFLLISTLSFAQKQFHITIQFVPSGNLNEMKLMLDDGKGTSRFPTIVKNGKIDINLKVYSKYAYLNIYSPASKNQKAYLITKEVSSITYYGNNKSSIDYPFSNGKLVNVIDLFNCKQVKEIVDYTQKERMDFKGFREKYQAEFKTNDSLLYVYKQKGKILDKKYLEFIKSKSDQYFYFWYFNFGFKDSEFIETDSLLQFYKEFLYPKYKNLFEAKRALAYLSTPPAKRNQTTTDFYSKVNLVAINQPAPEFTTTDISGKKFSLKELRGKYVLLNFWATWCGPCVEELPLFNKLRNDFPQEQLEMISISSDRKMADLENGIKKYNLNWTNVYQDEALLNKYQLSGEIPMTFLIDKDGKLVLMQVGASSDLYERINNIISGIKNQSLHK
jgi:peroxiredoxin